LIYCTKPLCVNLRCREWVCTARLLQLVSVPASTVTQLLSVLAHIGHWTCIQCRYQWRIHGGGARSHVFNSWEKIFHCV